ncbi:hypothetical protein [Aquibacillus albus]|uniref:Chemotaxis regulatin CheY-phosphate phosphatase CheZ n=1 Tax=Aquibacillus albus TaxID=1168171 RepID=A0ABS2N0V2_9BACI|nr:hypothetical protein [Aquibacillus albus]MBM7571688.1 chemotaxis regulatin CheY-phosphate phosphatase CheZ [Aquibacillus albus]
MNSNKIEYIPLKKIIPIYNPHITNTYLQRMRSIKNNLLDYDLLLAVEKDSKSDHYYLTGGSDRYHYLIESGKKVAPCIVEDKSNDDLSLYIKIVNRLFNDGESNKQNRKSLLKLIEKIETPLLTVISHTVFTKKQLLNEYRYDELVPSNFINDHTNEKTMNWICKLEINYEVKKFLYKSAGTPVGPKRLTHDSIKVINQFLKKESRFTQLTASQQIELLSYAISFKGQIIKMLIQFVDEMLD